MRRTGLMVGIAALAAAVFLFVPPIPQDPAYHSFADTRTLWGVANWWNVVSNIPFLLAALYGFWKLRGAVFIERWERYAFYCVLVGTAAVAAGSSYYHWHPDDQRLFWDRLPMTVVFLSILAAAIGERVSMKAGRWLLAPLIL
ncbi:MAG TPA: ceramidase domain-containing protein, partial [Bryobacteraceae bacterium]